MSDGDRLAWDQEEHERRAKPKIEERVLAERVYLAMRQCITGKGDCDAARRIGGEIIRAALEEERQANTLPIAVDRGDPRLNNTGLFIYKLPTGEHCIGVSLTFLTEIGRRPIKNPRKR